MSEINCRYAGQGKPRLLRSHLRDCEGVCDGCQPCGENHCGMCAREHVETELTCATCVGAARTDLNGLARLSLRLLGEAIYRGVNSEAANLAGPVADPEAWSWRKTTARKGGPSHVSLDEDDDSLHPLWVLGTWDMMVREHLEQPTEALVTIAAARGYLDGHLTRLAQDGDFAFEELAKDLARCRGHLEDVLHDGEREERGEKCPMCDSKRLVKDYGKDAEDRIRWRCPNVDCGTWYSEDEYRDKVKTRYVNVSPELNLTDMAMRFPLIPAGTIRRWAGRKRVGIKDGEPIYEEARLRPCGRDDSGRKLYRVSDVKAMWEVDDALTA